MKNKNIIICLSLLLIFGLSACSEKQELNGTKNGEGLPVLATIDTRTLPASLGCDLFIFWKSASETSYQFKEKIDLTSATLPHRMEFPHNEVGIKQYRFLFVAQPISAKKMQVSNNGNEFQAGDDWLNLQIKTTDKFLTPDYYYGILDKTGQQIISDGSIHGQLNRLVGQIVLDIFRINEGAETPVNNPIDIVSSRIASVIDRVHKIDLEYTGLTESISFDQAGNIQEKTTWPDSYKYTISPQLGDTLQLSLPQETMGLYNASTKGAVRIKGISGFYSTPKIRAKYIFTYYDTTPICGNNHTGAHSKKCFTSNNSLILNLPESDSSNTLLSIIPNHYTLNKAGIRLDRIIDLKHLTPYIFDTTWTNSNVGN